jgi:hypothetical protein
MKNAIKKFWSVVIISTWLLGVVGLAWTAGIWYQYQLNLPRRAEPANGRSYPLNVHGIVVYQTREERDRLNRFQFSSITLCAVSVLMTVTYKLKFRES